MGRSDLGRQRTENQDRWRVDPELGLFIVADGVGSCSDGALAAQLVTELLGGYVSRHHGNVDGPPTRLSRAVAELSNDLYFHARDDPRLAGASTTLVAALIGPSRAVIAHLGDSRAYLHRDGRLHRLTVDHSLVQALVDAGDVAPAQADHHPARGMLTRYVAMTPPALPDATAVDLRAGDRILLCTDGLHGVLDEALMTRILDAPTDPGRVCDALIGAANDAGGPDNVTAVTIDIAAPQEIP